MKWTQKSTELYLHPEILLFYFYIFKTNVSDVVHLLCPGVMIKVRQKLKINSWVKTGDSLTDLKKSRDPPPAATVLMSSWGACRVTPAVVASNTCSYWPAYRLTSVDVPGGKDKVKGVRRARNMKSWSLKMYALNTICKNCVKISESQK